ncbi:MAG: BamA/TamA family outer membrane protein [Bryobacteraceae bacterium]|nr:BamA/TamA family outer membrane protein [Bryobacteraceae bacterium]
MSRPAACLLLFLATGAAQTAGVRFDPPSIHDSELRDLAGPILDAPGIRAAIERIYATGRYEDIVVERDGADLVFRLTPRWFTGMRRAYGAEEPPSAVQLVNAAKLGLGEEFGEARLQQAVANLVGLLRSNGFYTARVLPQVARRPEYSLADVRFDIEPGERARFAPPNIRGDGKLTDAQIRRATGWQRFWGLAGYRAITESRVENGVERIRRLLEKKGFLNSQVSLIGLDWDAASNRATPALDVRGGLPVDLSVEGFRIGRGRLRSLVPVFQENSLDRELLNEGARNIAAYLESQGYFSANVFFDRNREQGREQVRYTVERGPRSKVEAVEITGNRYFDRRTLAERMEVVPATWIRYRRGRYSEKLLERDREAILALYRSNGFLDAKVETSVSMGSSADDSHRVVSVRIDEGEQSTVGSVTIEGVADEDKAFIADLMQSKPGQPYSETQLAADRDAVLNAFFNLGYAGAALEWSAAPGSAPKTVDVKLEAKPGRRQFVRDVVLTGFAATDRKLIESRLLLKKGEPLSLVDLLESQKRLYDLGIFARVDEAIVNPEGEEVSKVVIFDLEEARKYSLTVGLGAQVGRIGGGVESFDAPAGATGFSPRLSLAVTRNNFLGQGQSLSTQGRLSNIQQRIQITNLAPRFRDRETLSLAMSLLYDRSNDVRTFSARRAEAAIQLSERLSGGRTLQGRFALRRVSIDEGSLKIEPQMIPLLAQPVRLGIFSTTFFQDRRDDPINSRKGSYSSIDLGIASEYLGSQSDFARMIGRNSTYHRLGGEVVFARTVSFGVQERLAGGPAGDVPLPERFFAGGAANHRGFPENQAGPRDTTTGFPIGGKALLIFGHELRYPLLGDNLGGVLFHDMGNVFSRIGDVSFRFRQRDLEDFNYMVQSVGFGLRYRTPIGPIRIDLAFSPNSPRFFGFQGTREQLLFGQGTQTVQRINRFQFHFSLGQAF